MHMLQGFAHMPIRWASVKVREYLRRSLRIDQCYSSISLVLGKDQISEVPLWPRTRVSPREGFQRGSLQTRFSLGENDICGAGR
jgi:hypothetical protein